MSADTKLDLPPGCEPVEGNPDRCWVPGIVLPSLRSMVWMRFDGALETLNIARDEYKAMLRDRKAMGLLRSRVGDLWIQTMHTYDPDKPGYSDAVSGFRLREGEYGRYWPGNEDPAEAIVAALGESWPKPPRTISTALTTRKKSR